MNSSELFVLSKVLSEELSPKYFLTQFLTSKYCSVMVFVNSCPVFKMPYNGLALGAVADFGAQNRQYTTKVDAR
jgi:hypothetical protein